MKLKSSLLGIVAAALLIAVRLGAADAPAASAAPVQRVSGIGGFFFRTADPVGLSKWYKEKLGVDPIPSDYGQKSWTQEAGPTAFAPFAKDTKFGKNDQGWMINFRVNDLDAMVAQLRAAGEKVKVDPTVYPNGRFAHMHDPDGNPIELWEPAKSH
ncbi:MAG TPA: VOC family protein [Opitutaceae bacterium]|jgi:catechol 2,3-dioxygenase-like lactoylglutathione lyase family enzyme|nr:VOC family protein [Opitutaceae bacterium]